ncbi:hypothetical protein ACFX2I_016230 [Malus domestica]
MTQGSLKDSVLSHVPSRLLEKGQQVLEKHEGIGDLKMFRQTYLGSQYDESRKKSHALDQTFLIPKEDGDLRKKAPVTDHLHFADDLYIIRQNPDESLCMYVGHFSHEYSHCAETNNKTALKAFTAGLRDCFFKYMINANTWKTYSEMMGHTYNHASAEAKTYQEKPPTTIPYQQTYQSQGKRKDFHPHQSHFSKRSKGHYRDNQGYCHDNPRPQTVNTVGQARVRTCPTPRYEAYTLLNATCVAIYPSIAHLISKPKPRHPDYKPTKNTDTFCCYHEHNGYDNEKCITFRDHIEALAREGKLINSSFTLQRVTVTNAR